MSHVKQTWHKLSLTHINDKLARRYLHRMMFLLFAKLPFIALLNNVLPVRSPSWKGRGRGAEAAVTERDKAPDGASPVTAGGPGADGSSARRVGEERLPEGDTWSSAQTREL